MPPHGVMETTEEAGFLQELSLRKTRMGISLPLRGHS